MLSAALLLSVLAAEPATFAERLHGSVDVGGSLLEPSLHVGVEGGVRVGVPRIVLRAEWNPWISLQTRDGIQPGVVNVGAGVELRWFDERLASVAMVGISVLLFRSAFDQPGHTGLFFYVQPTVIRVPVGAFHLRFAPLSMAIVAPSLDAIPLVAAQFRTSVGFEW
ncbi:MAG: hypothetical protein DI536_34850 [Archangium gephyra]|uniref:Uncharacterized protein n=1 Tax=Archangium gephyra TaxID=48 RepID=A0A2W5SMF3_9BACT|nr:MAG: hypothetical protein DI536_34850 [Archangium gephyra]